MEIELEHEYQTEGNTTQLLIPSKQQQQHTQVDPELKANALQSSVKIISGHFRMQKRLITRLKKRKNTIIKQASQGGLSLVWHTNSIPELISNPPSLQDGQVAAVIVFINHWGQCIPSMYLFKDTDELCKQMKD